MPEIVAPVGGMNGNLRAKTRCEIFVDSSRMHARSPVTPRVLILIPSVQSLLQRGWYSRCRDKDAGTGVAVSVSPCAVWRYGAHGLSFERH